MGQREYEAWLKAVPARVERSRRRRRTIEARREGGAIVVRVPAHLTRAQEREAVTGLVAKVQAKEARRRPSAPALARRAAELGRRHFGLEDAGSLIGSIEWSDRQQHRWGSAQSLDGRILISSRLRGAPEWVLDYVLLHELAHLVRPGAGHGPAFRELLERYPRTARAEAFLDGAAWAEQRAAGAGGPA
ncbi:MAG: M48 family metallopeptidase [Bifidobacteriaceae bacterium]|jgi:predicted metal-dependent hydrolase|nr:M48 family metallopeptidase [Bifidobacteriaceae bacterium]